MTSWTCPGCGDTYIDICECETCHMRGDPWLVPVVVMLQGVAYLVKRQLMGATTVVTADGKSVHQSMRGPVIAEFLSQQHPTV